MICLPRGRFIPVFLCLALSAGCGTAEPFDVVFVGGQVFDGTGSEPFLADVGIREGRIEAVGDLSGASGEQIDATGLLVAPGFIDAHSHAELSEDFGRDGKPFLAQGITTVVLGLDGGGPYEVDERLTQWATDGIGVNALTFVGHGAVRRAVMGIANRAPTPQELDEMKSMVRKGMDEGAFGLSTGLFYVPGFYASTEEVIELAKVAAEWDEAIYDTHDRDLGATYQGIGYDASVQEAIRVGRGSGLRVIFSHFNPQGASNYGRASVGAQMIEEARAEGVDVWAAQHPYTATQSSLRSYALPRWAAAGGPEAVAARFEHADTLAILEVQIMESLAMRGGPSKILFVDSNPDLNGSTLAEVAAERGQTVPETVQQILTSQGNASVMNLDLYDHENTKYLAQMSWMMTCTDGRTPSEGQAITHPRVYGAFPRKYRLFAGDEEVVSVSHILRSFSGLAADFFRLSDRGYVRPGMRADLVVLDLERYRDLATVDDPHQYAEGAVHVLVNGEFAIRDSSFTDALPGHALRYGGEVVEANP